MKIEHIFFLVMGLTGLFTGIAGAVMSHQYEIKLAVKEEIHKKELLEAWRKTQELQTSAYQGWTF